MSHQIPHQTLTPARANGALKRAGISLTEKQKTALYAYLNGSSKNEAARLAGYAPTAVWSLFEGANMRAATAIVLENFLVNDAAPAALRALYSIVSNDAVAAGVRVSAANSLLDRAGFDAKRLAKAGEGIDDGKPKTAEQLREEIAKLEAQLGEQARDITPVGETNSEPITNEDLEMYA